MSFKPNELPMLMRNTKIFVYLNMCGIDVSTFWGSFWTNVLAGIAFAILLYAIQHGRYWWWLRRRFHKVDFEIYNKEYPPNQVRVAKTTVSGNTIKYTGQQLDNKNNEGTFTGEFIMNPLNLKIGTGLHIHDRYDGFNFPRIIIKDNNTLFVETVYISKETGSFQTHPQAFIWKRSGTEISK